jgi:hypothetical protein
MSLLEREDGDYRERSFVNHDKRHDFLVGDKPKPIRPPDPADPQNRLDDEERRRLMAGGRESTRVSSGAAPAAAAAPRATLTGLG